MSSFAELVAECRRQPPLVALVLGSGLGTLAEPLKDALAVSYSSLAELGSTSVPGHHGVLLLAEWGGLRSLVYSGRLHYYEGHPWRRVEQPVLLARDLGAKILLLTNAAGGIRGDLTPGSLMALRGHLDWTQPTAWRQSSPDKSPYSARLLSKLHDVATELGIGLSDGVYAQVTGPSYETKAEIRALRSIGADAVGMSTAREINRAIELGMECAALSCITNRAAGLGDGPIHHEEVLASAATQRDRLARLLETFLQHLPHL
ncbi:MAG: purine-nucleoside phosphorylase [Gemmataceae bacterium]|nr:purine-nucleoside phosphorylase [Gemmataceae bacterium]MCI0743305.1 purine-nucleoside phosphorylase [Gemmataceae bacterium]